MSDNPRFKGTIEVDIRVWNLADARRILDQLVDGIEKTATELNGGVSRYHWITKVKLKDKQQW